MTFWGSLWSFLYYTFIVLPWWVFFAVVMINCFLLGFAVPVAIVCIVTSHIARKMGITSFLATKIAEFFALSTEDVQRQRISLYEPGLLPWACMQFPGFCLVSQLALLAIAAYVNMAYFYLATAALTFYVSIWAISMAVFSAVGAHYMRRECAQDWHAKLQERLKEHPDESDVMHILILPNYKESEKMLLQTLENLARSPEARDRLYIVLAMEEREVAAREKAGRLIQQTTHLFAGVKASFHPPGIPKEVAGKSSNTQWAFKECQSCYASQLSTRDPARVFISVGDADTLWHPQFLSALAYQGLTMPLQERVWTIFQPPVLLMRNLFSVPGVIRVSGLATLLFELSGLAHQRLGTHIAYSTYSLTLSLALHSEVGGWDADVVAEDHHMFCKCYFAALWEEVNALREKAADIVLKPRVHLEPVWLPTSAYLVESPDGYVASLYERFVQARRHSYGVAELGYVLLQYVQLMRAVGPFRLPLTTHMQIISLGWRMFTVHIINTVQACSLMIAAIVMLPSVVGWLWSGGLHSLFNEGVHEAMSGGLGSQLGNAVGWALAAASPLTPATILCACTIVMVVLDLVEGRYSLPPPPTGGLGGTQVDGAIKLSAWEKVKLATKIQIDTAILAEPTVFFFGTLPELLAAWMLFRQTDFEYVVGSKPEGADEGSDEN